MPAELATARPPRARPIIFSGPMVRAIFAGQKSQTRRPVKVRGMPNGPGWTTPVEQYPGDRYLHDTVLPPSVWCDGLGPAVVCPYGEAGNRLWVRETWGDGRKFYPHTIAFKADYSLPWDLEDIRKEDPDFRWRSPLFLKRRDARLVLRVTEVRVQRVQDITEEDAIAEGVLHEPRYFGLHRSAARGHFRERWEEMHGANSFGPTWVWVVSFRRVA